MRTRISWCGALAVFWACTSCSTGPRPPAPGSPAFIWGAAKQTYKTGDFRKTSENLMQLVRTESEFAAQARPWAAVMSAGLALGYLDLAQAYEAGAKANRLNPTPFRKQVSMLQSLGSASALEFAETVHILLDKNKDPDVTLAFDYPTGSMTEPANLRKISAGMLMQDSEAEQVLNGMLQRGVVRTVSQVTGNPDDPAKTLEIFKAGEPKVPRPAFLFGLAKSLNDVSALYGPARLDQPQRLRLLCQHALDALAAIPETKDSKALKDKIQAALKKARAT
jgi:hypothetical protein